MRMTKRSAVAWGGVILGVAAALSAGPKPGDVRVHTDSGHRDIAGKEAEAYHAVNAWLEARLKEADSIRVGSTYADVAQHFKGDGGLSVVTTHRFVSILCPYLKIDVEFEEGGAKVRGRPVAAAAKVVSVSKPYFEREFAD